MKTFDRVLVLALTLALWALAIGQVTRDVSYVHC